MIKLKGFITYNIGGGYCWVRIGNLKIEWMVQKWALPFTKQTDASVFNGSLIQKNLLKQWLITLTIGTTEMTKKKTVEFEEGWADELMEDMDMTQEDIDNLMNGIIQLVTAGEILEDAVRVEDLPEDEQQEIYERISKKNTRH